MGFKTTADFLKYLTMGARAVHHTISQLAQMGFQPVELERASGSNKIWTTKVKRLRLPDILCVRTGLRVEVKAKSALKLKMSHGRGNPDRYWDAGLRDTDLIAFVATEDKDDGPFPVHEPAYFTVGALRETVHIAKESSRKAASEGSETSLEWATTVPSRDGEVLQVTPAKIIVRMFATQTQPERTFSFELKGKKPYVRTGDEFKAGASFLSGTPKSIADPKQYLSVRYDPFDGLRAREPVDQYVAVRALRFGKHDATRARAALEKMISKETEPRVRLESAASAAALGSSLGEDSIAEFISTDQKSKKLAYLRMEAVLILAELGSAKFAAQMLRSVADNPKFGGDEVRQAAVWGLGRAGVRSYNDLLSYTTDTEEGVALHAIAAFGRDTPTRVIERLIANFQPSANIAAPAASETLRQIGTETVLKALIQAHDQSDEGRDWILATLGRLRPELVRAKLRGSPILKQLEPMLLFAAGSSWLTRGQVRVDMDVLLKQDIWTPVRD